MTKKNEVNDVALVKDQVKKMQSVIEATNVTSQEELVAVAEKIKQVKSLAKIIKEKKEKFTEPAKAIIEEARTTYDPMLKACTNAEEVLKGKAKKYMLEEEEKRRAKEAQIAARVERGTMKPETGMKKIEEMPQVSKTVETDTGSKLRIAKRKVAKIANPELIPKEYWVIDEVRVRREALAREKANLPQIPGVEIEEVADMASF